MENFMVSNNTNDSLIDLVDDIETENFTELVSELVSEPTQGIISEPILISTTKSSLLTLSNTAKSTSMFNLFETTGSPATEETTMVPIQEVSWLLCLGVRRTAVD